MTTHIDKESVEQLAQLARIECSELEKEQFIQELQSILQYVSLLAEVDTSGVEPMYHVIESEPRTPLRDDQIDATLTTQAFLKEAPEQISQLIKVPKFQKE